jgi:cation diffusion facilitator CzcD-associated flavoprotein CzcO
MTPLDYTSRYCIVGGGASGITTAKNLLEYSIPFDLIEREDDLGAIGIIPNLAAVFINPFI